MLVIIQRGIVFELFSFFLSRLSFFFSLADRFGTQRAWVGPGPGAHPHLVVLWTYGTHHKLNINTHCYIVQYIQSLLVVWLSLCYYVIIECTCLQT